MNKQRGKNGTHRQQNWDKTKQAKLERESHVWELQGGMWVSDLGREGFPFE